jgi:hypothetical protein
MELIADQEEVPPYNSEQYDAQDSGKRIQYGPLLLGEFLQ